MPVSVGVAKYLNSPLLSYSVLATDTVQAVCPRLWQHASSHIWAQHSYHDVISSLIAVIRLKQQFYNSYNILMASTLIDSVSRKRGNNSATTLLWHYWPLLTGWQEKPACNKSTLWTLSRGSLFCLETKVKLICFCVHGYVPDTWHGYRSWPRWRTDKSQVLMPCMAAWQLRTILQCQTLLLTVYINIHIMSFLC